MIRTADGTPHVTMTPRGNSRFAFFVALVRRIIGVPDYDRYRQHMTEHHPECEMMTEREFAEDRLLTKYSKPGQRCC